jgi:hypothetical protein
MPTHAIRIPPRFARRALPAALGALVAALSFALAPAARADDGRPADDLLADGWTVEGYIDPAAGEAQRPQVALDDGGDPIAVWAGRARTDVPYEILYSRFDGTTWSPAARAFAASPWQNQLPRLSRADDGTVWIAWLQFGDADTPTKTALSILLAARWAAGAWSAPETVAVDLCLPRREEFPSEFALLAVDQDEVWVAYALEPNADPFGLDRDLWSTRRTAAGWGTPQRASDAGLAETRPELALGPQGRPVVFFGFANSTSLLWAKTWTGTGWEQGPADALSAIAIFEHAVQRDTSGAVRMIALIREDVSGLAVDHVREFVWDTAGFHPGPILLQAAVPLGGKTEPPDWQGLSLATAAPCTGCPAGTPPSYRPLWIDFTPGPVPRVFSALRTAGGFEPIDVAGTTFEPAEAYPHAAYDPALDRWYAVWAGPPSPQGLRRAKFSWTQEFAGDLGIGASLVEPDTARIEIVCSGDASGREIRVHRLAWNEAGPPPLAPPIPAAAVEVAGSPAPGPCPLFLDDLPGPGSYYYYAELVADGTFPADYARTSVALVLDDGPPPPPPVPSTAFLAPYPQPALGRAVTLPFDLRSAATNLQVTIHDLRGRVVRRIVLGPRDPGRYRGASAAEWNGRDDDGRRVPGGVYFARLWLDDDVSVDEARRVVIAPTFRGAAP